MRVSLGVDGAFGIGATSPRSSPSGDTFVQGDHGPRADGSIGLLGVPSGRSTGTTVSDPEFEALLDKMAEEMEDTDIEDTPVDRHVWKVERLAQFSNDVSKYECGKCGAKLNVRPDQSIAAALQEQEVLENCAEHAVQAVTEF